MKDILYGMSAHAEYDNHLSLFSGEINIDEKLHLAEETGSTCVIEVKRSKDLIYSVKELLNDKRSK